MTCGLWRAADRRRVISYRCFHMSEAATQFSDSSRIDTKLSVVSVGFGPIPAIRANGETSLPLPPERGRLKYY